MACKEKSCNEKLIELSIAAYRVKKPPCSFSRGVKTSTFFSSTNNIIMISTLKIFIKKEKKVHIHIGARTSMFLLSSSLFLCFFFLFSFFTLGERKLTLSQLVLSEV